MNNNLFASTIHHLRPGLWPFIWVHGMSGFVCATGPAVTSLEAQMWLTAAAACASWAVLLGGAATVITAYFGPSILDTDDGEGSARADSVPVHKNSVLIAIMLMLLGVLFAIGVTWDYFDAYLIGIIALVANAAPPLRLAGLTYGALAGQAFGYGVLTFYAGYAISSTPSAYGNTIPLYFAGFIFLFLSLRAVFWRVKSRMAPLFYWTALLCAFACLAAAGGMAGNRWSVALLAAPLILWVVAGMRRYDADPVNEQTTAATVLGAWLLTDVAVAMVAVLR